MTPEGIEAHMDCTVKLECVTPEEMRTIERLQANLRAYREWLSHQVTFTAVYCEAEDKFDELFPELERKEHEHEHKEKPHDWIDPEPEDPPPFL